MISFSPTKVGFYVFLLIINSNFGLSQFLNTKQVRDIVDDIRKQRFTSAQEKISNNRQSNQLVSSIIHNVYSNTENNTNIILDFSHNVTLASLSFQILRGLKNEMTANNHSDPLQLIALYRGFEDDVIFKQSNKFNLSTELKMILDEIKVSVKTNALQILKTAMYKNEFEGKAYIRNVTSELFNFFYEISDEVMRELVNQTYPDVPSIQVVENIMYGSRYIPQQIEFFLALYEKLEANQDLNNDAVLRLAYYIRILAKLDKYRHLFQPKKDAVNAVIRRMPKCARNLYFASDLCIWNRGSSEYLYAAASQHNLSRRGIFTYEAIHMTAEAIWQAEFFANVYFKSRRYRNEYLYASTTDKYDRSTRHVLTWVDDGFVGDTSAWKIELHGDYCFIKNVNFQEYLYTSRLIHAPKKRYVFTAIRDPDFSNPNFQWQMRNCG